MIEMFTGTPGSGKSLHTAQIMYYHLRSGRPCIANFDIRLDKVDKKNPNRLNFIKKENWEITPRFLMEYAKSYWNGKRVKENEILLVLDECQVMFDSRTWMKSGRHEWISFFTQHRKYGYKIIMIVQFEGMIDKQIRTIIEYKVIHRKVSNFGFFGLIITLLAMGQTFVAVRMWAGINQKIDQDYFIAKKKYYEMYDTFNDFGESKQIAQK